MKSINVRIKEIRTQLCNGSNAELALKMGEKENTVSNWVSR